MQIHDVQVKQACEISAADLHDAYVFCELRRQGIGMAKVLETPSLYAALRNTAIAMKKKTVWDENNGDIMIFETEKHYQNRTILKNVAHAGVVAIGITHWHKATDTDVYSILTIDAGACHIHSKITLLEARELAEKLLRIADEIEAHQAQLDTVLPTATVALE